MNKENNTRTLLYNIPIVYIIIIIIMKIVELNEKRLSLAIDISQSGKRIVSRIISSK